MLWPGGEQEDTGNTVGNTDTGNTVSTLRTGSGSGAWCGLTLTHHQCMPRLRVSYQLVVAEDTRSPGTRVRHVSHTCESQY